MKKTPIEYSSELGENPYDIVAEQDPGTYVLVDVDTNRRKVLTKCGESKTDQS